MICLNCNSRINFPTLFCHVICTKPSLFVFYLFKVREVVNIELKCSTSLLLLNVTSIIGAKVAGTSDIIQTKYKKAEHK